MPFLIIMAVPPCPDGRCVKMVLYPLILIFTPGLVLVSCSAIMKGSYSLIINCNSASLLRIPLQFHWMSVVIICFVVVLFCVLTIGCRRPFDQILILVVFVAVLFFCYVFSFSEFRRVRVLGMTRAFFPVLPFCRVFL